MCARWYRYDESGTVVGGLEFTVASRASIKSDSSLDQADARLHSAMDKALQYVLNAYAT